MILEVLLQLAVVDISRTVRNDTAHNLLYNLF